MTMQQKNYSAHDNLKNKSLLSYIYINQKAIDLTSNMVLDKNFENIFDCLSTNNKKYDYIERRRVLDEIDAIILKFVRLMKNKKNLKHEINYKLLSFGSYKLGVHTKDSDIDLLLCVPRFIDRYDFFNTFIDLLKKSPNVKFVVPITDAYVPVVKVKVENITIDIVVCQFLLDEVPNLNALKSNEILKSLSPKCILSLTGYRVTEEIIKLIPNNESFKMALKAIKFWAKKRLIYSNSMGYLGGISWTILVLKLVQLYPKINSSIILLKFFKFYSEWDWKEPIILESFENFDEVLENYLINFLNTKKYTYQSMQILTPSQPRQNCSYNVTASSHKIIITELENAKKVCNQIINNSSTWNDLFKPYKFFDDFDHFISIIFSNQPEWASLIESKLRLLILHLEREYSYFRFNPKAYQMHEPSFSNKRQKNRGNKNFIYFIGVNSYNETWSESKLKTVLLNFTISSQIKSSQSSNPQFLIDIKYVHRKDLDKYLHYTQFKTATRNKILKERN